MKTCATIVDYGSGNLLSVQRALEHCGAEVKFASTPGQISDADFLILPGVGAFAEGMQGLRDQALVEPLRRHAKQGRPLLGICLGMQMLATSSCEFGTHEGLDLIPGHVVDIPNRGIDGRPLKVPHIGWARLEMPPTRSDWQDSALATASPEPSMYLVHSFHLQPSDQMHVLANYRYGGHPITAAVQSGNVIGFQFHPEKSADAGLGLLQYFLGL